MSDHILRSIATVPTSDEGRRISRMSGDELDRVAPAVVRTWDGGSEISIRALREAMDAMPRSKVRVRSDRWLAPRVHANLRLTRREASDPGVWRYLAHVVAPDYVRWRWKTGEGVVVANHWSGGVNKQALARLWWGAELFRDGSDYGPVEDFFRNQDLPNSYLHRTFARIRPFSLSIVAALREAVSPGQEPTSDEINDVAKRINLILASRSMETIAAEYRQDVGRYLEWVRRAPGNFDEGSSPIGPDDGEIPPEALAAGMSLSREICEAAGIGVL